jgi:hypothetical protein
MFSSVEDAYRGIVAAMYESFDVPEEIYLNDKRVFHVYENRNSKLVKSFHLEDGILVAKKSKKKKNSEKFSVELIIFKNDHTWIEKKISITLKNHIQNKDDEMRIVAIIDKWFAKQTNVKGYTMVKWSEYDNGLPFWNPYCRF